MPEYVGVLFWWSELHRELSELQRESGFSLARILNGNTPNEETETMLRRRLERCESLLDRAARMETGPAERFPDADKVA